MLWLFIFSAHAERALVTPEDVQRLSGFAEHKKSNADFDKNREAGFENYLNEKEAEAKIHYRNTKEQQLMPKEKSPGDNIALYKKDLAEREEWEKSQALARKQLVKENKALMANPLFRSISEEEELDLISQRPRFDYKKRTLYSSKGSITPASPSGRRMKESGSYNSPSPPSAPPGPTYDDFPPPPPPMFGNEGGQDDFPPPPPAFDDFDNDFPPPPPPPPPMDFPPPGN